MNDTEDEPEELACCYSVGSYGPFPITFYALGEEFFYHPQEHDDQGPFSSLEAALAHAKMDFGMTDGGFHDTLEDAETHAEWMRAEGYGVE
jgi:hypothetical protein